MGEPISGARAGKYDISSINAFLVSLLMKR